MSIDQTKLRELLKLVGLTKPVEIDCDEFLRRAAVYLDCVDKKCPPPSLDPETKHHLTVCPECREEFEVLTDACGSDRTPDPT